MEMDAYTNGSSLNDLVEDALCRVGQSQPLRSWSSWREYIYDRIKEYEGILRYETEKLGFYLFSQDRKIYEDWKDTQI